MNETYKQFSPTPYGLLDIIDHVMSLEHSEQLKEGLWLIKHRYFIGCETCNQTGKVSYPPTLDPLEQEIGIADGTVLVEDCPHCEGKGFNFVWDVPDYAWKVEDN